MAIKYHNSPKGPRICNADVRKCQYMAAGAAHYDTQQEAWAAYEKTMTDAFGLFPKQNRLQRELQITYRDIDRFREGVSIIKDNARKDVARVLNTYRSVERKARSAYQDSRRKFREYADTELQKQEAAGVEPTPRVFGFAGDTFTASPRVLVLDDDSLLTMQRLLDMPSPGRVKAPGVPVTPPPATGGGTVTATMEAPTTTVDLTPRMFAFPTTSTNTAESVSNIANRIALTAPGSTVYPRSVPRGLRTRYYRRRAAVAFVKLFARVSRDLNQRAENLLATKYSREV